MSVSSGSSLFATPSGYVQSKAPSFCEFAMSGQSAQLVLMEHADCPLTLRWIAPFFGSRSRMVLTRKMFMWWLPGLYEICVRCRYTGSLGFIPPAAARSRTFMK
jgi:hypothetical protein